jgi:NitT/TauT family transport system ATP-binding protein
VAHVTDLAVKIGRKHYSRDDIVALQNLNFSVPAGQFVALVGPSGAGKTTILNIILGLDNDYEGEVLVNGQSLKKCDEHPARIGCMFQEPRLMPWLTVAQNLDLVLDGQPGNKGRVHKLLEQVELSGREASYPGQLSGGQKRRVALARAFAVDPHLMLMDEPFVSLDEPSADRLRHVLRLVWRNLRPTVVFVAHNLREAIALADEIVFLSASPGMVIRRLTVDMDRPRELQDPAISTLQDRLLRENPEILSGLAADKPDGHSISPREQKTR